MDTSSLLFNKSIVITGASSGAGNAAALEFAGYGSKLILAARNEYALNEVAAECTELGATVLTVVTDVTDPKAMINLANTANDWAQQIDIWINNAGVLAVGDFDATPMEVHAQVIRTNLLGYMNGAHAVLPFFKDQGYGTMINNISIGGYYPVPYGAGYTASKFGLRGFFEALKGELSGWPNIHVCDLFPGFLDTPGIQHAGNFTGKTLMPAPPVYDPKRLAKAMVKVAQHPKDSLSVGSASVILRLGYALFPRFATKITASITRTYLNHADPIALTSGNLFNTVDYGMSTNGGWSLPRKSKTDRKYIAAAGILAMAAGYLLVSINRNS